MTTPPPLKVLVAGGGPAALEAVLTLRSIGAGRIETTLLTAEPDYHYRPLSVMEAFTGEPVRRYPLGELVHAGVDVRIDALSDVDADQRTIRTTANHTLHYDALIVATGAIQRQVVPRALTFTGDQDPEQMHGLIQDVEMEYARSVAFVVPEGVGWSLPIYELALLTGRRAAQMTYHEALITIVTPELRPLEVFGYDISEAVAGMLTAAGVHFSTGSQIPAGASVVALPALVGRSHPGLPAGVDGFIPVDADGRVHGLDRVFAAGDGTDNAIKQGGLAAQQAAAAAIAIAELAGIPRAQPTPARVLRGVLLSGERQAFYLERELDAATPGRISPQPLWSPPSKVAGERLGGFLDDLDADRRRPRLEHRLETDRLRRVAAGVAAATRT